MFEHPIRLRWILVVIYVVIGGVLFGTCFLHMGHSPSCEYAYYALIPAGYASVWLLNAFIPRSIISSGPLLTAIEIMLIPIPFLASCAQYYLVGWILDKLVERLATKIRVSDRT